jgi:hypothetical protein
MVPSQPPSERQEERRVRVDVEAQTIRKEGDMALVNSPAVGQTTVTSRPARWRILIVALATLIAVGLIPLGASPAAAAGPARKASADIWYAVKIGVVAVQANGTGQVNAFADRYVGGSTTITLYEWDLFGSVYRTTTSTCSWPSSQRCWTQVLSDRYPLHYAAYATLTWTGHGQSSRWTPEI